MFLGKWLICKNSHLPIASPNAMAGDDVTDVIQIYKATSRRESSLYSDVVYSSGKWLYLKGNYYRDPFLTSMIMAGSEIY